MTDQQQASVGLGPGMSTFHGEPPHHREQVEDTHGGDHTDSSSGSGRGAAQVSPSANSRWSEVDTDLGQPAGGVAAIGGPESLGELATSLRALGTLGPAVAAAELPWWRRLFGLGPSEAALAAHEAAAEQQLADARRRSALRTQFAETLTITVISSKGSAGKTPTTRGLAAAFGRERGGGVVAVDMNELRGTLAMRSVTDHGGHVGGLVESADYLLGARARSVEVERCMSRQPDSYEWVLASDPTTTEAMSVEDFERIHTILRRFYPLLVIDTGNAELASSWRSSVAAADLLVVPMKWKTDHIGAAAAMLTDMRRRGEQIAGRTVIVGTNGPGEANELARAEALRFFDGLPIIEIPVDAALNEPIISWEKLQPATQTAYETLGATLIRLAMKKEANHE